MIDDDAQHDDEAPEAQTTEATADDGSDVESATPDATEAGEADTSSDPLAKVRHEAAGYRRRLRETEQDRDRLAGNLQAMQRADVERLASANGGLARGDDLWTAGVALDELLTDEGTIDPDKVHAARDRVLKERPHWASPAPNFDGGARQSVPSAPDFADTLRKAAGGH